MEEDNIIETTLNSQALSENYGRIFHGHGGANRTSCNIFRKINPALSVRYGGHYVGRIRFSNVQFFSDNFELQ